MAALGARLRALPGRKLLPVGVQRWSQCRALALPPLESLRVQQEVGEGQEGVWQLQMSQGQRRNAMGPAFWRELPQVVQHLSEEPKCRVIVLSGEGPCFTAGMDLQALGSELLRPGPGLDAARTGWGLRQKLLELQRACGCLEGCPRPVIAAVHGACVGAGVDLICACDIRYCSQDAWFQIKEVDMGLAADLGTLQRLPKIVGNQSLVNELAFTARKLPAAEALSCGLVSRVLPDKEALMAAALELAKEVAAKSPVAVQGTKVNLLYARDHPVQEGLAYVASWNMAMLQTEDIPRCLAAAASRQPPAAVSFPEL